MKIIITLLAIFFTANNCLSQSILNYFGIEEIKQIEISFAPNMNVEGTENKVAKTIIDSAFINKVIMILDKLPASGSIHKDFPKDIPTWRIDIIDQDNEIHKLTFYGIKLRTPISVEGDYYYGLIGDIFKKKLYLAIRSQMIGDWYNCD